MIQRRDIIIVVLMVALLLATFVGGRLSKHCAPDIESVETTTHTDTVYRYRTQTLHWVRPLPTRSVRGIKKALRIGYSPHSADSTSYSALTEPLSRTDSAHMASRWITDSISSDGVGLRFDHLVQGELLESRYQLRYPEVQIRTTTATTTRTRIRREAIGLGCIAILSTQTTLAQSAEIAPVLGYRYDRLQVTAGYGLIYKSIILGLYREF